MLKVKGFMKNVRKKSTIYSKRFCEDDQEANALGLMCLRSLLAERIIDSQREPYREHSLFQSLSEHGYVFVEDYENIPDEEKRTLFTMIGAEPVKSLPSFISRPLPHIQGNYHSFFKQSYFYHLVSTRYLTRLK